MVCIYLAEGWNHIVMYYHLQADVLEPPTDMPEVMNDFDIEEEEILMENRWVELRQDLGRTSLNQSFP